MMLTCHCFQENVQMSFATMNKNAVILYFKTIILRKICYKEKLVCLHPYIFIQIGIYTFCEETSIPSFYNFSKSWQVCT